MPFTPFHWGPGSMIGLVFFKIFDFTTLIIASVIIDVEPLSILIFNLDYPLHGFFHSFLGGSVIAIFISIAMYFLKTDVNRLMRFFKLEQDSSFKKIVWTSFFGVYLHILLDSPLYSDMKPFYPLTINPFYGLFTPEQIYLFSGLSFFIAVLVYLARLLMPHTR
ncbi:MAG: hypothetical protein OIN66_00405 [Candidatus Methanoperedens sp.]|nr:hypothetical protein [Candidatus Methanoperedens sp.]